MASLNFASIFEIITLINNWALNLISSLGYPGLAVVMFLENVFPPIPSEIILPLAGSLTLDGTFSLAGITLVGMLGSVAGAWVFYGIGFWFDEKRIRYLIHRFGKWFWLSEADLDRAIGWFRRHGDWVVFFGRMVPMVRSLISIPAGLARMNLLRFTLFTALGTACWGFFLAYLGRYFGENWAVVEQILSKYDRVVVIAFCICGLILFIKRYRQYRHSKTSV